MSQNKSMLIVIVLVIVVTGALVGPMVLKAASNTTAVATAVENPKAMATLAAFDDGRLTADQVLASGLVTDDDIKAYCGLYDHDGNMAPICNK
jgi:hypothetical protein